MELTKKIALIICAISILHIDTFAKNKKRNQLSTNIPQETNIKSISTEATFIDAMQSKVLGNIPEAIGKFLAVLKLNPHVAEAHFQLGQIYYSQRELDKAELATKRAIELNANDEWYYIFLEQILSKKGDYDGAADAYTTLLKLKPDDIDSYYYYALLLERANRYKEAIATYNKIESIEGINHDITAKKLPLYDKLNDKKGAIAEINKLIQSDTNNFKYLGYLGAFYEVHEDFAKAEEVYKKMVKADSTDIMGYYLLSELYSNMDDLDKQNTLIDKTIRSEKLPLDEKIDFLIAILRSELQYPKPRNIEKIISAIEYTHQQNPTSNELLSLLVDAYSSSEAYDKAINLLKDNLTDSTGKYKKESYIKLLSIIAGTDKNDELLDYAEKGGKEFTDDPVFDFFAAVSSMISKNHTQAQKFYRAGLEKQFNNEQLKIQMLIGLGDASSELKDDEDAEDAYEKALEMDPNNSTALNNYAYFLSIRNVDLQKAERMSRKSNLLEDNNPAFQDTYAWIQYMKGEYFDALIWMEKALKSANNRASFDMLDHYGDILYKLDRKEEAIKYWNQALHLDENNETVKEKILKAEN